MPDEVAPRSWVGWLVRLPFRIAVGLLRMGVMLAAFGGASVGGLVLGGLFGASADVVHAVVGALLGAVMVPVGLWLGMVAWFVPATARVWAVGGDTELDADPPTRADGVWLLVGGTAAGAGMGGLWAALIDVAALGPAVGFAAVIGLAGLVVLLTGGRHVAELFLVILGSAGS